MYLKQALTALVGLTTLSAAVPTSVEREITPAERGLKHRSRSQKRSPLVIQQTVVEQSVTVVQNQNLGVINDLARVAETELAALVQAQADLITQIETIKNNIRINHFKARFSQVNTVIVTVTNVVDARDPANVNTRYMMNQLRADNGVPDKELVVMMTQADTMTIGATPTVDLSGVLGGAAAPATAVSAPTGQPPAVAGLDPNAPFGQWNGSMILPYNTTAPTPKNAVVVEDPADIILAGSKTGLFVESIAGFQSDCAAFGAQASALLDLAAVQLFSDVQAAANGLLTGLVLGAVAPAVPPAVMAAHPDLAAQAQAQSQPGADPAAQAQAQSQAQAQAQASQAQPQQGQPSADPAATAAPAPAPAQTTGAPMAGAPAPGPAPSGKR